MHNNNNENISVWAVVLALLIDAGLAWCGFTILTTWNLVLWQQVLIGIVTFIFTIDAVKNAFALLLGTIMALLIFKDIKDEILSEFSEDSEDYVRYYDLSEPCDFCQDGLHILVEKIDDDSTGKDEGAEATESTEDVETAENTGDKDETI